MKTFALASALALGSLALAGCAGAPVVGPTNLDSYTSYDGARFVGAGQLVLIGSAGDQAVTERLATVAANNVSQGAMSKAEFLLTAKGENEAPANNRVVVVIGGGNGATLCSAPPQNGGRFAGSELSVAAAACSGTDRLSSTRGTVSGVTGIDDPAVARLFRQIGAELFPLRNPDLEDQNDNDWQSSWAIPAPSGIGPRS